MIQSNIQHMIGAKSEGFSGSQFCFGVESFYGAAGELAFGPEPVEQKSSVTAQLTNPSGVGAAGHIGT